MILCDPLITYKGFPGGVALVVRAIRSAGDVSSGSIPGLGRPHGRMPEGQPSSILEVPGESHGRGPGGL